MEWCISALHHTTVAVRILHSNGYCKSKQFQQELEILSRIRHRNSLLLLGACPDHGCLVCETQRTVARRIDYSRKTVPPIPWLERFQITWEVASALSFLHTQSHNLSSIAIRNLQISYLVTSSARLVMSVFLQSSIQMIYHV
ncbi:hypothetical protein TSUD_37310 [Trifolium subterraneum]|uniref:RING-type E3 ubiquitin transferase n=1 Tax=Trifolium subterraneum TaxID=3900 RepID=A0A2Z6LIH3_TRISU|nr:hypothetical protein TSUD_37310 [Trifolium subterraneum]